MAIAVQVGGGTASGDGTASPLTWSYSITTAGSAVVVLVVLEDIGKLGSTIDSCTVGGITASPIFSSLVSAGTTGQVLVRGFIADGVPSGAQTVSVSATLNTGDHIGGVAVAYTGVDVQATVNAGANVVTSTWTTVTGAHNSSINTSGENSWVVTLGSNSATTGPTLTSSQTSRGSVAIASVPPAIGRLADNNAAKHPPGSVSVTDTSGASASQQSGGLVVMELIPTGLYEPTYHSQRMGGFF